MALWPRNRLAAIPAVAGIVLLAVVGSDIVLAQDLPQTIRAVCVDADAPKSLAQKAAAAGLNTLVVRFDTFGGATDEKTLTAMREWARTSAELKMAYLPAIRVLGPLSALGVTQMEWRRSRNLFGVESPVVCPLDAGYWRHVAAEHVNALAGISKDVTVHGVLLSLYRNWSTERHGLDTCYCDHCLGKFFDPNDFDGDAKAAQLKKLPLKEKLALMRRKLNLAGYHDRQMRALADVVSSTVISSSTLPANFAIGLLDCGDTWFDRGVLKGLCRDDRPVLAGLDSAERASVVDLVGTFRARWAYDKLRVQPIVYLDTSYFLPEDVAHEVAPLADRDIPFCLTHTRGWWCPEDGPFRVNVALGTVDEYCQAVKESGSFIGDRRLFFGRKQHALIPRVALVHGERWSWTAATLAADMMKHGDTYPDLFPAWGTTALVKALGYYDVVILAPGFEEADPRLLRPLLPKLESYMRCGGVVSVLFADSAEKLDWLGEISPSYSIRVTNGFGAEKGVPNKKERAVLGPIPLGTPSEGSIYLSGFSGKYVSLMGRKKGGSYLLKKDVGKGMLVITPNKTIPFELVANLWFEHRCKNDSLVARVLSGQERLRVGENRLRVGVGDQRFGGTLSVEAHVISPGGKRVVSKQARCDVPSEGVELGIDFTAAMAGVYHLVVTVWDPESTVVIGRRLISLDVPLALQLVLDKDYYTDEPSAQARVRCNPVVCSPDQIELVLDGSAQIRCERSTTDRDTAYFRVPLSSVPAGRHKLVARAGEEVTTAPLLKRKAAEGAVKILQGKALSEGDRRFLPVGMYDLDPSQAAALAKAGLTLAFARGPEGLATLRESGLGLVERVKQEPVGDGKGIVAWQLYDEPSHNNLSGRDVRARYEELKGRDPYHPALIALLGDLSRNAFGDYLGGCDVLLVDSCPLPFYRIDSVGESVRAAVAAGRGRRPIWAIAQCFDWRELLGIMAKGEGRAAPSALELRNMVYQALVGGANGVVFWSYPYVAARPELATALRELLGELSGLSPVLMGSDSRHRVVLRPAASPVLCRLIDHEDKVYLFACNPTRRAQEAWLTLPSSLRTAAPLGHKPEAIGTMLEARFAPLEAKVFVLGP